MTRDEEIAWGRAEQALRIVDLAVRTPEGLRVAQANAEVRRKAAGLTRTQAATLVAEASREIRRQEFRASMTKGAA